MTNDGRVLHRLPLWPRWCASSRRPNTGVYTALARVGIERETPAALHAVGRPAAARCHLAPWCSRPASSWPTSRRLARPASSQRVMELLAEVNRELGVTVLVSLLHQVDTPLPSAPRHRAGPARVVFDGPTHALSQPGCSSSTARRPTSSLPSPRPAPESRPSAPSPHAFPQAQLALSFHPPTDPTMNRRIALILATTAASFALAPAAQAQTKAEILRLHLDRGPATSRPPGSPCWRTSQGCWYAGQGLLRHRLRRRIEALPSTRPRWPGWVTSRPWRRGPRQCRGLRQGRRPARATIHKDSPLGLGTMSSGTRQPDPRLYGDPNSHRGTAVPASPLPPTRWSPSDFLAPCVQPRDQPARRRQQAGGRGHQQHRELVPLHHHPPTRPNQFREIWRSPMIASDPIVWRKDLDEASKPNGARLPAELRQNRARAGSWNIGCSAFRAVHQCAADPRAPDRDRA